MILLVSMLEMFYIPLVDCLYLEEEHGAVAKERGRGDFELKMLSLS